MVLTTRLRNIISGLVALVLVIGATTVGITWSFGAFDDGYRITADFAAAGQGLVEDSDVKIRGLDVGHVESIELRGGRALVTMFIDADIRIPARSSSFTVRPKTLFGEKFIDVVPGPEETTGPYFDDGDEVPLYFAAGDPTPDEVLVDEEGRGLRSAGGFELERVLADAYPILEAIDPDDVFTVLDELAEGGRGLGETINRSIVNGERVLDVQAARDAETRQFIEDLAALTGELADRAPDLVAGAADLNMALPVLTEDPQALGGLLGALETTSSELADLLEANTAFIDSVYGDGQVVLDLLYDRRDQVLPLVIGLRQYVEAVGGAARIPVGDGTVMAAVKSIIAGDACGIIPCPSTQSAAARTGAAPALPTIPGLPESPLDLGPLLDHLDGEVSRGTQAVLDLLLGPGPR